MSIPPPQLETWSHQGSVNQSSLTYRPIRTTLEADTTAYSESPLEVFLQGSYGNDTNIYKESDVDIVICLDLVFYHDTDLLDAEEKRAFSANYGDSDYSYRSFRSDVEAALAQDYPGVSTGNKAIHVAGYGSRRDADVVAAMQYRRYYTFSTPRDCVVETGICFFAQNGAFIVNFPKQHMDNCTRKHQLTDGMFKPLVRILKNIRRHLIDLGTIQRELAPGYFLECLLYNVPDEHMTGTYSEAFIRSMRWLAAADRSNFECASGQVRLFGDRIVPSWRTENCDRFLQAVGTLWDRW